MDRSIRYISTNRHITGTRVEPFKSAVSFRDALFTGIAPDGGLFVPDDIPRLTVAEIQTMADQRYAECAHAILSRYLVPEIEDGVVREVTESAYTFDVPLERVDDWRVILRLDRGPTASFKDFAARFMARMMRRLKPADRNLTILVATSGDTGSAVGDAFHGLEGIRVIILYPENEVSPFQQKQLDGIGGNVQAVAIAGTFDDCQGMVKRAFSDNELQAYNLTSANSINIGRILPQIAYYFYAYAHSVRDGSELAVSVPSGNFGNSLGCEIARRMGLPVRALILGVNENDEFPRFLETGIYQKVTPSKACLSNAMNVGNPSNLARYFELYGGTIDKEGTVHKQPDIEEMRRRLRSYSVSDEETIETIRRYYRDYGTILEPHGAVGMAALDKYMEEAGKQKALCLETAHPAKFADIMRESIPVEIEMPAALARIQEKAGRHDRIENNYYAFKEYIKSHGMD